MLQGKKYTPQDVIRILRKRKWLIIVPWIVVVAATAVVAKMMPNRYQSESVILVIPPRVPEGIVKSIITQKIADRLPSIQQQVLSRTRLERIIQDFGLYASERKTKLMEELVAEMKTQDIQVGLVKGDAFYVRYSSKDPQLAMKVTERIAALFVDNNLRDRDVLAEGTSQFLDSQLDDARRRLTEHEKKLEEFRRLYSAELPTQQNANLQSAQNTQNQIQALNDSINRDRDQRLDLQRNIADLESEVPIVAPVGDGQGNGGNTVRGDAPLAVQVATAQQNLDALLRRLKADHPDVKAAQRALRDVQARAAAAEVAAADSKPAAVAPVATTQFEANRRARLRDLRAQVENLDRDIERKQQQQTLLQQKVGEFQRRADAAPGRESELIALNRDYDTLQKVYNTLLAKSEEAKLSANMERRQIGEQFQIVDPARLPERPFSPNRPMIIAASMVAGLVLGLMIVGALEARNTALSTEEDVLTILSLPVLATVPAIVTRQERRLVRRRRVVLACATAFMLVAVAAVAWKLRLQDWVG